MGTFVYAVAVAAQSRKSGWTDYTGVSSIRPYDAAQSGCADFAHFYPPCRIARCTCPYRCRYDGADAADHLAGQERPGSSLKSFEQVGDVEGYDL